MRIPEINTPVQDITDLLEEQELGFGIEALDTAVQSPSAVERMFVITDGNRFATLRVQPTGRTELISSATQFSVRPMDTDSALIILRLLSETAPLKFTMIPGLPISANTADYQQSKTRLQELQQAATYFLADGDPPTQIRRQLIEKFDVKPGVPVPLAFD